MKAAALGVQPVLGLAKPDPGNAGKKACPREGRDQRQEAPYPNRHLRLSRPRLGSRRRYSRSRRRAVGAGCHHQSVPMAAARVRRWRIWGRQALRCTGQNRKMDTGNHQTIRHREGLRAFCLGAGLSSGHSPSSTETVALQKTSSTK